MKWGRISQRGLEDGEPRPLNEGKELSMTFASIFKLNVDFNIQEVNDVVIRKCECV